MSVSPRSGGHSYAAYGLAGDVVIDMANLRSITLNADKKARVETGNRLGDVASQIYTLGQRALPHGSCPYVCSFTDFEMIMTDGILGWRRRPYALWRIWLL